MSDTARMLAETTSRVLAVQAQPGRTNPSGLLTSLREAGLDLALLPEADGGVGCLLGEAAEVVRAWGAYAAPLPIVELLLAPRLSGLCGKPELATNATVAQERTVSAQTVFEAPLIPGCEVVLAILSDEKAIAVLPCDGPAFSDLAGNGWVRFDPTVVRSAGEMMLPEADALEGISVAGTLLTAVLISGAMDRVVDTMIEYANTRTQFGRPIGKFQAVQHLIADASAEATVTRAVVEAALREADAGTLTRMDQLAAKAQAGRAATLVASAAHQLLGAIGFTEEHELHHFTKRLWWWRDDWGRQADCEERLGALAAGLGEAGLWPAIVGE